MVAAFLQRELELHLLIADEGPPSRAAETTLKETRVAQRIDTKRHVRAIRELVFGHQPIRVSQIEDGETRDVPFRQPGRPRAWPHRGDGPAHYCRTRLVERLDNRCQP